MEFLHELLKYAPENVEVLLTGNPVIEYERLERKLPLHLIKQFRPRHMNRYMYGTKRLLKSATLENKLV